MRVAVDPGDDIVKLMDLIIEVTGIGSIEAVATELRVKSLTARSVVRDDDRWSIWLGRQSILEALPGLCVRLMRNRLLPTTAAAAC